MLWRLSHRFDTEARLVADRHYNRQKPGTPQFVPPGRCLVLKRPGAVWVTSWPFAEFTKHEWAGAWVCSAFRRESGPRASDLIRSAVAATRWRFGEPPRCGHGWPMVTFVDREKVKPTMRRSVPVWGWCYLQAEFEVIGETKGGLLALGMRVENMPEPQAPTGAQMLLGAA